MTCNTYLLDLKYFIPDYHRRHDLKKGPNGVLHNPFTGDTDNCGPGWHWQLVASVAQQQEAMRITTGQG
jgi:hypothetical protein